MTCGSQDRSVGYPSFPSIGILTSETFIVTQSENFKPISWAIKSTVITSSFIPETQEENHSKQIGQKTWYVSVYFISF